MKVFISYAQADEALAQRIGAVLREAGFEVWNADTEIVPGENWAEKVAAALRDSEAMVVLLTPEALRSRWVRHDIEYALGEKRYAQRLIPVRVLSSTGEANLEEIPWILQRLKMIKLAENAQEDGLKQIAQVLKEAA